MILKNISMTYIQKGGNEMFILNFNRNDIFYKVKLKPPKLSETCMSFSGIYLACSLRSKRYFLMLKEYYNMMKTDRSMFAIEQKKSI